jgi:tetratricopeptide (TPR) repeat protein
MGPTAIASQEVAGDSGAFQVVEDALKVGNKAAAGNALITIIDNEAQVEDHAEAYRRLAGIYHEFQLSYSALLAYGKALEADTAKISGSVGVMLDLAEEVGDEQLVGHWLGTIPDLVIDEKTAQRAAVPLARYHLDREDFGTAMAIADSVPSRSLSYPDAQALRGVILSVWGRHADALAPLVTAQAAGQQYNKDERFNTLLDLNIARAYYGAANWGQAMAYYAKVDRDSAYWPEANFERAWAHFRADDMQGAIALLHTHQSPFFDDWHFPEADLLRAYALFLMCKFPEASARIDRFVKTYEPQRTTMDTVLTTLTLREAYEDARRARDGQDTRLPLGVLRSFTWEDRFAETVQSVDTADAEIKRLLGQSSQAFGLRANEWLATRRDARKEAAGGRVIAQVKRARDEITDMLTGVEITRLDLLNFETQLYEQAANTGTLDIGDKVGKLRKIRKRRGSWVWPFEGEYWADELGWYRVDARPDCPANMASTLKSVNQ